MANTALPQSYLAINEDTFCYLGQAHALYVLMAREPEETGII